LILDYQARAQRAHALFDLYDVDRDRQLTRSDLRAYSDRMIAGLSTGEGLAHDHSHALRTAFSHLWIQLAAVSDTDHNGSIGQQEFIAATDRGAFDADWQPVSSLPAAVDVMSDRVKDPEILALRRQITVPRALPLPGPRPRVLENNVQLREQAAGHALQGWARVVRRSNSWLRAAEDAAVGQRGCVVLGGHFGAVVFDGQDAQPAVRGSHVDAGRGGVDGGRLGQRGGMLLGGGGGGALARRCLNVLWALMRERRTFEAITPRPAATAA
jgi:hypothetical protein